MLFRSLWTTLINLDEDLQISAASQSWAFADRWVSFLSVPASLLVLGVVALSRFLADRHWLSRRISEAHLVCQGRTTELGLRY